MVRTDKRWRTPAICCALVVLTALAFWPVRHADFVNFDDPDYVTDNPHIQQGPTWKTVKWAFSSAHAANWHPLTWLSHALDWKLYGNDPLGHHATNVVIHAANAILLFLGLRRLTGSTWRSSIVAALFALHPLHVESVAWVAERKDVLSTLFFLLTIWAYGRFTQSEVQSPKSKVVWYGTALILFAFGLMSKPMVVTLPFVLLLLDFWPLNRVRNAECGMRNWLSLLYEKIPFFALAAASCVITLIAQKHGGSVRNLETFPIWVRAETVVVGYASYIEKMVWPLNLCAYYTHPSGWPLSRILSAAGLLAFVTLLVISLRRNRSWLVVGWLWFLGTLVPVIGIVQVGAQYIADRYTYIPLIGLFVAAVWGAAEIVSRFRIPKLVTAAVSAAVLCACLLLTRTQAGYWRTSAVLFTHALDVTTNTFTLDNSVGASLTILAHNNLGLALAGEGKLDQAVAHYTEALKIRPDLFSAHYGLGMALAEEGKLQEAITHYAAALQVAPDFAEVRANLAYALAKQGKPEEAAEHFREVLRLKPDDAKAHFNLGLVWADLKRVPDAVTEYREALRLNPELPDAMNNLAWIYSSSTNAHLRNGAEAVRLAERACELTKNRSALFVGTLAAAYAADGKFAQAIATAEKARAIALAGGETNVALRNEKLIRLYQRGQAVHE